MNQRRRYPMLAIEELWEEERGKEELRRTEKQKREGRLIKNWGKVYYKIFDNLSHSQFI
jgi:hypothetical protein